jgi:two-component system, OmpR family, sensor histidine kinase KdpD
MSRLQTGALRPATRAVSLDEVVFSALASLSGDTSTVAVNIPDTLPQVRADPALLERAVANLIANARAWNPRTETIRVDATVNGDYLELHVVDRGPGIPPAARDAVFKPFQRLGDAPNGPTDGVGLGLAVARGFVEAMGGVISLEDTPIGGLTAIISMPLAESSLPPPADAVHDPAASQVASDGPRR